MTSGPPEHVFDPERATTYRARSEFVKTAILVEPVASSTELQTAFGEQRLAGSFYIVADGDSSYGAARAEFEAAHENVGDCRWVKRSTVLAYTADTSTTVVTRVAGEVEGTVVAEPGDWIVQQATGEVMVITPEEFESRYQSVDD